ncbi:MAG: Do family serine endopeptidase [Pseudomonadota bacterium]
MYSNVCHGSKSELQNEVLEMIMNDMEEKKIGKVGKPLRRMLIIGAVGVTLLGMSLSSKVAPVFAKPDKAGKEQSFSGPFGRAPLSFADLVEKVRPAVVSINVKNGQQKPPRNLFKGLPDLPDDHPLNEFFKRFRKDFNNDRGKRGQRGRPRPSLAQGSGFIISEDGYVVTNNHVIDKADDISVTLDNGDKLDAKLIGTDFRTDLALLKIKAKRKFKFVKFAKKEARVGDWVLAVGNPFGLGGTVTAGIVSAGKRDIGSGPYDYIQIDAAVNRGNSGGPAFNLQGNVVGVNTAIFSPSGGNVGIAFAVPSAIATDVIEELKRSGTVSRGWLGVTIQNVSEDIAESLGLDKPSGALVTKISKGGPASKSNIKVGDAIVSVNGTQIDDSRDLARKVASLDPKSEARVTVFRDGSKKNIRIKLGLFPSSQKLARLEEGDTFGEEMNDLGLSLAPASSQSGVGDDGVIITDVDPESSAAEKGLKKGDIILKVSNKKVANTEDVIDLVRKAKRSGKKNVLLYIRTKGQPRFVTLSIGKS